MPTAKISEIYDEGPGALEHKYSSTQVNIHGGIAKKISDFSVKHVPDDKLADGGREKESHITVLYGLHDDDAAPVEKLLTGEKPVTAKIGALSVFSNPDFDVLKLSVVSPGLAALNRKLGKLSNTNDYPKYKPHVTIAYLKPGEGKKYNGRPLPGVTGKTLTFDKVIFSPPSGERKDIALSGK